MTDEALTPGFLCSGMRDVNNRSLNLTASCSATLTVAIRNKDETVTIHVSYRSFKLILPVTGILIASQDFIYLFSVTLVASWPWWWRRKLRIQLGSKLQDYRVLGNKDLHLRSKFSDLVQRISTVQKRNTVELFSLFIVNIPSLTYISFI